MKLSLKLFNVQCWNVKIYIHIFIFLDVTGELPLRNVNFLRHLFNATVIAKTGFCHNNDHHKICTFSIAYVKVFTVLCRWRRRSVCNNSTPRKYFYDVNLSS